MKWVVRYDMFKDLSEVGHLLGDVAFLVQLFP